MLVRRRVEDDVGRELLEDSLYAHAVANVGNDDVQRNIRIGGVQRGMRLEEAVFAVTQHDEAGRPRVRDLPA